MVFLYFLPGAFTYPWNGQVVVIGMRKTVINDHIVDALATYICITAVKEQKFIFDVDITKVSEMLHATFRQREKAVARAGQLIQEFK